MKSSKSSKSKSKSSGGGGGSSAWSDWIWSPEYGKYYMYCTKNGQHEYHWQETQAAPQQPVETIPREQPNVEEMTSGFDNLSTSTSTTDSDYSYAPQGEDGTDVSYTYPTSTTSYDDPSLSRKGKETAYESQPHDGEDSPPADPAPPLDPFWGAKQEVPQCYVSDPVAHQDQDFLPPQSSTEGLYHEHEGYTAGHNSGAAAQSQDSGYGTTDTDDYDHNAVLQEALTETYGTESQGGPSTEPAYGAYPDSEDDGTRTPTGPASPAPSYAPAPHPTSYAEPNRIVGTFGTNEDLDPRYVVEPSHKFRPGSIFKVLWCEPSGTSLGGTPTISDRKPVQDRYGGSLFVGFRRFVVVANDDGHCTCVPILTYQGKACKKRGVKPQKHGMVYHSKPHRPLQNEPELGFPPVRAKLTVEGEKLDKASRVNYSKLVTVEHNVKVFFIGHISPDAMDDFADAVDTCWERKTHSYRRSKR